MGENGPSAAPDNNALQAEIAEAYAKLSRAVQTATTVADGAQLDAHCTDAHRALSLALKTTEQVVLEFGPDGIDAIGTTLAESTDPLVQPLIDQGVGALHFDHDLTVDDVRCTAQAWAEALSDYDESPESLLTRMWSKNVKRIHGRLSNVPKGGFADWAAASDLPADPKRSFPNIKAQLDYVSSLNKRNTESLAGRLERPYLAIRSEDQQAWTKELESPTDHYAERTALAFLKAAQQASRSEFNALAAMLKHAVTDLLAAEAYVDAAQLVEAIRQHTLKTSSGSGGPEATLWESIAEALHTDEFFDRLVELVDTYDQAESALLLLNALQRTAVSGLLSRLPRMRSADGRRKLSEAVKTRYPSAEALESAVKEGDPLILNEVLFIAEERDEQVQRKIWVAALEHVNPEVRTKLLEHLPETATKDIARWLYPMLADPSRALRKQARERLVASEDPGAIAGLSSALDDPSVDKGEQRTIIIAIGTLGGPRGSAALQSVFEGTKDNDLKVAAINAMGSAGDPSVVDMLDSIAKKLFTRPAIKLACKDAIRRIEQHQRKKKQEADQAAEEKAAKEKAAVPPPDFTEEAPTTEVTNVGLDPRMARLRKNREDPTASLRKPKKGAEAPRKTRDSEPPERETPVEAPRKERSQKRRHRESTTSSRRRPPADELSEIRRKRAERAKAREERATRTETPPTPDPERPATPSPNKTERSTGRTNVKKRPPLREDLPKVAGMPDFDLMFANYVYFEAGGEHIFGRRYQGRLLDLHTYQAPTPGEAYHQFFQSKVQEGFMPQSNSQRDLSGTEALEELDWNHLVMAYAKLMGKA